MTRHNGLRSAGWKLVAVGAAGVLLTHGGCQSQQGTDAPAVNASLRHLDTPPDATRADADRATLARFVGTWTLDGWSTASDGSQIPVEGRAAGVIERQHFVLLDLEATSGEMQGRAARKAGSMVFASEPGIGLTLTAWGDASPAMNRLVGTVDAAGSVFNFTEARTPAGARRLGLAITFETDDRWVAEIRDTSAAGDPLIARYTFQRSPA